MNRRAQAAAIHRDREGIVRPGVRVSAGLTASLPAAVMRAAKRGADWRAA